MISFLYYSRMWTSSARTWHEQQQQLSKNWRPIWWASQLPPYTSQIHHGKSEMMIPNKQPQGKYVTQNIYPQDGTLASNVLGWKTRTPPFSRRLEAHSARFPNDLWWVSYILLFLILLASTVPSILHRNFPSEPKIPFKHHIQFCLLS